MLPGLAGLIGWTLLECGVSPEDPAILSVAEIIRAAEDRKAGLHVSWIYTLSSALFFLNRWDESRPLDEPDRTLARTFALRIISGQLSTGAWSYGCVVLTKDQEDKLLDSLQRGAYKPNGPPGATSISNTQFAMLAVWGARKHGVSVCAPLLAVAAYFHAHQYDDGHWIYPNYSLSASSTCAGLIALALEKALLEDTEFTCKEKEPDGLKKSGTVRRPLPQRRLKYLAKTIGRKKDDPGGGSPAAFQGHIFNADAAGDLYFLWALERVGVIYSLDLIGGESVPMRAAGSAAGGGLGAALLGPKNWYNWGFPIVLQAQNPDGSWDDCYGPMVDTCFALLFLKRANIAKDLAGKLLIIKEKELRDK